MHVQCVMWASSLLKLVSKERNSLDTKAVNCADKTRLPPTTCHTTWRTHTHTHTHTWPQTVYSVIQKDGLNFVSLYFTWSAGAFAFTQAAYLFKLVIPTTNGLPRWRLNVETKTKRTLHSSRRLSFNELTNAKNLVLHSSHFALNWRCCTAVH